MGLAHQTSFVPVYPLMIEYLLILKNLAYKTSFLLSDKSDKRDDPGLLAVYFICLWMQPLFLNSQKTIEV